MELGRAKATDVDALEALRVRSSTISLGDADLLRAAGCESADIHAAALEGRVLVAADLDGPVGFAYLGETSEEQVVELEGLFVDPEKQGRGIGSSLCQSVVALAARRGARAIVVTANAQPNSIYHRFGFRITEATRTQFGPAVRMTRALP